MVYEFDPKGMPFRRLGSSGLRVPLFSLGLTLGETLKGDRVKEIIKTAFDNGINMLDTAEGYNRGQSEVAIGRAIQELDLRRTDLIITTKIFFGTRTGPNDTGLSRKHIIEGTKESLERLQLDYVDIIFAHVPDISVPMEEVVRAFNWVIQQGWALYWATSEWSAHEIEAAHHVATRLGLIGPVAEQCQHHMFHRDRPEKEYEPLYKTYDLGTTVWSPLASGILTGKYNDGIPVASRFADHYETFKTTIESLMTEEGMKKLDKVRALSEFAESELGCSVTHLALAWVANYATTSTVILGASKPEQIVDNLKALDIIPKLSPYILEKIEHILQNKPEPVPTFRRSPLDTSTRV